MIARALLPAHTQISKDQIEPNMEYKIGDNGPYYASAFKNDVLRCLFMDPLLDYPDFVRVNQSKTRRTVPKKDYLCVRTEIRGSVILQAYGESKHPGFFKKISALPGDEELKKKPEPKQVVRQPVAPKPLLEEARPPEQVRKTPDELAADALIADPTLSHSGYLLKGIGRLPVWRFHQIKKGLQDSGQIKTVKGNRVYSGFRSKKAVAQQTTTRRLRDDFWSFNLPKLDHDALTHVNTVIQDFIHEKLPGEYKFNVLKDPSRIEVEVWVEAEVPVRG